MKTYEIKMKPTQLFNDLFKIRIENESENFDPINNFDDGVKLRRTLSSTLFRDLCEDKDESVATYQLFDIETVKPVEKKTFEVDVDLSTTVRVRVDAWDKKDATNIAEVLVESEREEYADIHDLDVYAREVA